MPQKKCNIKYIIFYLFVLFHFATFFLFCMGQTPKLLKNSSKFQQHNHLYDMYMSCDIAED